MLKKSVEEIYKEIEVELRSQYSIGYTPITLDSVRFLADVVNAFWTALAVTAYLGSALVCE